MDLKKRLRTAFIIILIVPAIMIICTGKAIISYQMNSIEQNYSVESDTIQIIANPLQILNRSTREIFNRIKHSALKNPKELENMDNIREMNQELLRKYSFLAIRKGEEIIFNGNSEMMKRFEKSLPSFGDYNTDVDGGIYIAGKNPFFLKQQDFYFSDGVEGTVFLLTDVTTLVPQIKSSAIQAIIAFIGIIILTAVILVIWLYRSIIRPLDTLKRATNEIKQGNLDYSIGGDHEDEIGLLCEDFEEMRIHLKELIEVRMQFERDSRELVSNISHDLKTPLTAIKGYAEGILDGVADTPAKQEKYLKTIYTKANDMTVLVDELAFYSKIDSNIIPYNFNAININNYFNDCIEELSLDLEVKNIGLGYENSTRGSLQVMADTEQLKRVINNIIGNAVKYLDKEEGRIEVHIEEIGDYVKIAIGDNGAGIAEKDLPNIFERFYRADASRNSKKGGSGLGLAIAKKIIEDHSGKIWASSIEGEGTTIYFTLIKWESDKGEKEDTKEEVIGAKVHRLPLRLPRVPIKTDKNQLKKSNRKERQQNKFHTRKKTYLNSIFTKTEEYQIREQDEKKKREAE